MMSNELYTIFPDVSIMYALKKIAANKKGFVIVVDESFYVVGVLTDGDIRRGFIKGKTVDNTVMEICSCDPYIVNITDDMMVVTELFKRDAIKFLPIVDENRKLVNIITKRQMHALLLQNIHADLSYNFMALDESIVEYEIFQKPWGFYKTTILNDNYQSKVISVKPGGKLSLQSHNYREEHWIVVHGRGEVQLDSSVLCVTCGNVIFIPKGAKHRLINVDIQENLIIIEVQIGGYLGEDDIIRHEDAYGRITK